MSVSVDLTSFSFHDASLVEASHDGSTIILGVEYHNDNDEETSVIATITGVEQMRRNNLPLSTFKMEAADGEIYRLKQKGQEVILIVFWHEYSPHSEDMVVYQMAGSTILLQAHKM